MTKDTKQRGRAAESVGREPTDERTPEEHGLPVEREDAPKGQPTSDRFQTEQAHRNSEKDAKDG